MTDKKKPLVLVVEDDMDSQMLMKYYLRDRYEIDFCESVTGAKVKLKNQHVDIILLDLALNGGEDGLDLVRYIRNESKWPDIYIIATTAHAFTADRDNCITAGCDDYLAKPFTKEDLLDKIAQNLK